MLLKGQSKIKDEPFKHETYSLEYILHKTYIRVYKMPRKKPQTKKQVKKKKEKRKIAIGFASILAIVSIIGFLDITLTSFFEFSFQSYMSFFWLCLMGVGFIIISKPKRLIRQKKDDSVTDITALVVGVLAIIAGVLSLPFLAISHPVFFAIKGVISIIAIIFIALETWVVKN